LVLNVRTDWLVERVVQVSVETVQIVRTLAQNDVLGDTYR
jgi:hypothetical protein